MLPSCILPMWWMLLLLPMAMGNNATPFNNATVINNESMPLTDGDGLTPQVGTIAESGFGH